jgi:uncharacterized protein with GYD domain
LSDEHYVVHITVTKTSWEEPKTSKPSSQRTSYETVALEKQTDEVVKVVQKKPTMAEAINAAIKHLGVTLDA